MTNWKSKRICKCCGQEFIPCKKTSEFCSKSCATKWRNDSKIKDGTHNFYKIEDRGAIARKLVAEGTHPFLKGNMSEESLKKKYEGIRKARKAEALEHKHAWQQPINFIENEYSRSISVSNSRNLDKIYLYISDTDFVDSFKIGWTYDISIREKDSRTHHLTNLNIILEGEVKKILLIEKEVKLKFFKKEYYDLYNSTEIFPISIKELVLDFIEQFK